MSVHITHAIYYTEVHLIFCSMVWLSAWALTSLPGASATAKHWIWVATGLNFVLPLGAIVDALFAHHISWATPIGAVGALGVIISDNTSLAITLAALWAIGGLAMLARLCARVAAEHRLNESPVAVPNRTRAHGISAHGIAVSFGPNTRGPAVFGLFQSHICLPVGIDRLLNERELDSVLMHELTHARRRDNLIRLLYEVSLCALWFHPLVWITGSRLALYRELSCDEFVIRHGHGRDLVSALSKLAHSDDGMLMRANAASFLYRRLAKLDAEPSSEAGTLGNALMSAGFSLALALGIFATVAHTACCFIGRA